MQTETQQYYSPDGCDKVGNHTKEAGNLVPVLKIGVLSKKGFHILLYGQKNQQKGTIKIIVKKHSIPNLLILNRKNVKLFRQA